MQRTHCDFCGKPIEQIDFYLSLKGGNMCSSCLVLSRGQDDTPEPILDSRQPEEIPFRPEMLDLVGLEQSQTLF